MTTSKTLIAAGILTALVGSATTWAAGPELHVGASCETTTVEPGSPVTVPIEFRTGTDDGGVPNRVSAIDFQLQFPEQFTVIDVVLAARLDDSGFRAPQWQGSVGLPIVPGQTQIALEPEFALPLPELTDGPVVEVTLALAADAAGGCAAMTLVPESVQFSAPPQGLGVDAGPLGNGAIQIAGTAVTTTVPASTTTTTLAQSEQCGDCVDNDGNGAIDLADPACGAQAVVVKRVKIAGRNTQKALLQAELPMVVTPDDLSPHVAMWVEPPAAEPSHCALPVLAPGEFRMKDRKKGAQLRFKAKTGTVRKLTLSASEARGRTTLTAVLVGVGIPEDAGIVEIGLELGDRSFFERVPRKSKKVFAPAGR
jgi:hypothetical protein